MSTFRNFLLLCILACFIIGGFTLITDQGPAMLTGGLTQEDPATTVMVFSRPVQSGFAVVFGLAGLVYLKIIWKLIHLNNNTPEDK